MNNARVRDAAQRRGYRFISVSYINILYSSRARVSGAWSVLRLAGEHGGQCYEAASATGAEP
jgi:hypothetical protein